MNRRLLALIVTIGMFGSMPAKADAWGADIPILLEILSNTVSQLYQLMSIVQQGRDTLGLMRQINSGLDDALGVYEQIKNRPDLSLYRDWATVDSAIHNIETIYGKIPQTRLAAMQKNTDTSVGESIALNHSLSESISKFDSAGQDIQAHAQVTSPKGAAKLTAQGVGVTVQVLNESLRAQSSSLKMQAQTLANENSRDKEETRQLKDATDSLSKSFKNHQSSFVTPEF